MSGVVGGMTMRQRAPRSVREDTHGHIIITNYDPVASSLVRRLGYHHIPYFVTEPDGNRALALHDQGISVVVGDPDDAATYRRLRLDTARMVVATGDDYMNTNVAFTVTITDMLTGRTRTYSNAQGHVASTVADTDDFPCQG